MTTPQDDESAMAAGAADTSDHVRAGPLIECFGGIRPMAAKLGVPVSTVQGWKQRDAIPVGRLADIEAAAAEHGVALPKRVQANEDKAAPDDGQWRRSAVGGETPGATDADEPTVSVMPPDAASAAATPGAAATEDPRVTVIPPSTSAGPGGTADRDPKAASPPRPEPQAARAAGMDPPRAGPRPADPRPGGPGATASSSTASASTGSPAARAPRRGTAAPAVALLALIVAVAAAAAVGWVGFLPDGPLAGRFAELDRRIAAVEVAPPPTDVGALGAALPALDSRLATLEQRVGRLSDAVTAAAVSAAAVSAAGPDLAALEQRLARLEQAGFDAVVAGAPTDAVAALVGGIDDRLTALEQAEAAAPAPAPPGPDLVNRFTAIADQLDGLERQVAVVEQRPVGPDPALTEAVDRFSQRLALLEAQAAVGDDDDREVLTLFLAAGRLQAAVAAGRPYVEELAVARRLAAADAALSAQLAPLAAAAATGVARVDELAARFTAAARTIIQADAAAAGDGWLDRTVARTRSIVSVRRIGEDVPGDTPAAIVARAELRLAANDLAGAVGELAALDGVAAASAGPWLAAAGARLAADAAIAALDAHAITVLETAGGG